MLVPVVNRDETTVDKNNGHSGLETKTIGTLSKGTCLRRRRRQNLGKSPKLDRSSTPSRDYDAMGADIRP